MQIFEFEDRRVHEGSHPPPWLARGRGDLVGVNGALQYVGHMSHYTSTPTNTRGRPAINLGTTDKITGILN